MKFRGQLHCNPCNFQALITIHTNDTMSVLIIKIQTMIHSADW